MKFLKTLTYSWLDSLKTFLPENLKMILLLTLNAIKDIIKHVSYRLIIPPICLIILVYFRNNYFSTASLIISAILLADILIYARPSIDFKNSSYYLKTHYKTFPFVLTTSLIYLLSSKFWDNSIFKIINSFNKNVLLINNLFVNSYFNPAIYIISPFLVFFMLFLMDSKKELKSYFSSAYRSFKMFIYNYPFCFIAYNVFKVTNIAIEKILYYLLPQTAALLIFYLILFLITIPFYLVFMTNFYVNQIHTKFNIYYAE